MHVLQKLYRGDLHGYEPRVSRKLCTPSILLKYYFMNSRRNNEYKIFVLFSERREEPYLSVNSNDKTSFGITGIVVEEMFKLLPLQYL